MLSGGFDGGAGSSYQGGSATGGNLDQQTSFGGFNINAAPAWAGGNSSGGGNSGLDNKTLLIGLGVLALAWFALNRKK
ncbi:MAG: hypothetical protein IBX55_18620 [Methyloprofundus sp.]|nr:hypothetical protein [Methyloprofundus sp.]